MLVFEFILKVEKKMEKKLTINTNNISGEISLRSKNIKAELKSRYLVHKLKRDFIYKKFESI